jgi:7-carboxy-7-deazaguanine synthase
LRCTYCDSEYAFHGGEYFELDDIVQQVKQLGAQYITVTGGEPLAQKDCPELLTLLCDQGFNVSIETSGAFSIESLDPRVCVVMDLKGPSSGEMSKNLYANIEHLRISDQVKFIISDRADYDWARMTLDQYQLQSKAHILFSPCFGKIEAKELAQWILDDKLNVRFQIQLHKLLWGDKPGH